MHDEDVGGALIIRSSQPANAGGEFRTGRTPFEKLTAIFKVTQGEAVVEEMRIDGPKVRLGVVGTASKCVIAASRTVSHTTRASNCARRTWVARTRVRGSRCSRQDEKRGRK